MTPDSALCSKCGWSENAHSEPFRSELNRGNPEFGAPAICSSFVPPPASQEVGK